PVPPATQDLGRVAAQEGVEVLTHGPIHEAFGEPVTFDPQPGLVVASQPPAPVEELPSEQRPEGDNVVWIPGYWGWDEARNDYVWVSGSWRAVPPGQQWIPGYWTKTANGYQWGSGFWASAAERDVAYLPPPPESLEAGPSTPPPSATAVWVPGCWIWQERRYAWRPGYWLADRPGWLWMPAHYVWTPSGCVFSDGYWDYSLRRRGLLFAPVVVQ